MKPKNFLIYLISLWLLIPITAATSHATVEVICFSKNYILEKGKPVKITDTFYSAHEGTGTVKLTVERVSSAIITLNRERIWGPSDFNQNVSYLEKDVLLNPRDNTLEVELRGKLGAWLQVEIIQKVEAAVNVPVADPFYIITNNLTPVTISAYIPDPYSLLEGVELIELDTDGTPIDILGDLNDDGINDDATAGDQVYTITKSFIETEEEAIKLRVSAALKGSSSRVTADLEIPNVAIPTIQDYSQYNQIIADIFLTLLDTRNNFQILIDPTISPDQFLEYLWIASNNLLFFYSNMESIYQFETSSPSNFPKWLDYLPVVGTLIKKSRQASQEMEIFINDGTDPRVEDIADWAVDRGCLDIIDLQDEIKKDLRKDCAFLYQTDYQNSTYNKEVLKEAGRVIVKEETGQFTSLTGQAIGELYDLSFFAAEGINFAIRKILDIFIDAETSQAGLVLGAVQDGETLKLPIGTHDIIFSFEQDQPRAIGRETPINTGSTFTVSISPGEVKDFSLPPQPELLASGLYFPSFLTVDQDSVYWTEPGLRQDIYVKKVSLSGGTVITLYSGTPHYYGIGPGDIVADEASVYWATNPGGGGGDLYKISKTGGTRTALASANQPQDVAIDDLYLYWAENNCGTPGRNAIRKISKTGGTVIPLTTTGTCHGVMAMDDSNVYFKHSVNNIWRIGKVTKDGGSITYLAYPESHPTGIAVDDTHVYWVEENAGNVKKVPTTGGTVTILSTGLSGPYRIVVDMDNVYWTEYAGGVAGAGAIKKILKFGGDVIILANGLDAPYDLAIDNNNVYWTERGTDGTDGAIRKISKNTP